MPIRSLLLPLALGVAALCQEATPPAKPTIDQRMKELFEDYDRSDRPGGCVVVVKDGKVIFQKAFGLASLECERPSTVKTAFDTGPMGQAAVGMALALLEKQGKLSLDDDIRKHVPGLPDWGRVVMVRHLLEHSSGLMDWLPVLGLAGVRTGDVITQEQVLRAVRAQTKLDFEPGSKVLHSDTNYVLLAEAIQKVTGQSLRDWTWQNLFKPLGMTKTFFRDDHQEVVDGRAFSYTFHSRKGYLKGADNLEVVGSHSLFTSIEDTGRWLLDLQNGTLGGPELAARLAAPPAKPRPAYWYGMKVDSYAGTLRLSQGGAWGGFRAAFHWYPERRFAAAVFTNWDYSFQAPENTLREIADIYLEPAPGEAPKAPPAEVKLAEGVLKPYAGVYRLSPGFTFAIEQEGSQLALKLRGQRYPLSATSETAFFLKIAPIQLHFEKDEQGLYGRCRWIQGGEETLCPRIELVTPTPAQLEEFAGRYTCAELDTAIGVVLKAGKLVLVHPRLGEVSLTPEARNHFLGSSPVFALVVFRRDAQGRIAGLHVDGSPSIVFVRR